MLQQVYPNLGNSMAMTFIYIVMEKYKCAIEKIFLVQIGKRENNASRVWKIEKLFSYIEFSSKHALIMISKLN